MRVRTSQQELGSDQMGLYNTPVKERRRALRRLERRQGVEALDNALIEHQLDVAEEKRLRFRDKVLQGLDPDFEEPVQITSLTRLEKLMDSLEEMTDVEVAQITPHWLHLFDLAQRQAFRYEARIDKHDFDPLVDIYS